ncbi:hypothetical protein PC128_g27402 [Phytophthora cactorum]|nr:hypothetical protein PC120_g27943 [Phytophthora cactorum]KAG3021569.1 hypothetical protein PC121_g24881 [Phytophthora cactorum]KAG3125035.1 hypothetical protein PC128_g27402 [Phytophthora cactorum]
MSGGCRYPKRRAPVQTKTTSAMATEDKKNEATASLLQPE